MSADLDTWDCDFIPRTDFLERYWDYGPGEHVTALAPTQNGKTTFLQQLLDYTAHERLPATTLVMKPDDPVVAKWVKRSGHRRVTTWPPTDPPWRKPPGWVLWPKPTGDLDRDEEILTREFRAAMLHAYYKARKGRLHGRILFADEIFGVCAELGLTRYANAIWTRGGGMNCGIWAASQRPAYIPRNAYSQAEHVFIGYDPDAQTRKRYAEIGGVDPKIIIHNMERLEPWQWLYFRRTGRAMCIVGS